MVVLRYLLLLLVCVDETTSNLIGGCAGTRYGCCPDGVTPSRDFSSSSCPNATADCSAFLARLPLTCTTKTNCVELDCGLDVFGYAVELDFIIHRCTDPVSVNVTMRVDDLDFFWTHDFFGQTTSFVVPNLAVSLGSSETVRVSTDVHIYSKSGAIYASTSIHSYLDNPVPANRLTLLNTVVLDDDKLPVSAAGCDRPPCGDACSQDCLWGRYGGVACYECPDPSRDCPVGGSAVCGSDSRSYSSYCSMGKEACFQGKEINVVHLGNCTAEKPTPVQVLTALPPLDSLQGNVKKFVDSSVAEIVLGVTSKQSAAFNKSYIATMLTGAVGHGYKIVVMNYGLKKQGDSVQALVTFFAYYRQGDGDVVVPVGDLVSAVNSKRVQVAESLGVTVVKVSTLDTSTSSSTGSDKTVVIIAAAVSVTAGLLITLVVLTVAYFYCVRSRSSATDELTRDDVAYLPDHDEINFDGPSYDPESNA